jgi:hypothetical protein
MTLELLVLGVLAINSGLWETLRMPQRISGRPNEERKANELITKVKRQKTAQAAREAVNQAAAARNVRELTDRK